MKYFLRLVLLGWCVGAGTIAYAQQILCERQLLVNAPRYQKPAALLSLAPDSMRLVGDFFPLGPLNGQLTRMQRLNLNTCDTLPAGPSVMRTVHTNSSTSVAATNRRGQVLLAQVLYRAQAGGSGRDSSRIVLQLFNRNGTLNWRRVVPPQSYYEGVTGMIEAPGGGFFACGAQTNGRGGSSNFLFRIDSLGQVRWRRTYRQGGLYLDNPNYTRTGTLVFTAFYTPGPGLPFVTATMEVSQQGDSLTTRQVSLVAQQNTRPTPGIPGSLLPLRDGGFAIVGVVDSANTGYTRPFLVRLDRNLNVIWTYIHRQRLASYFAQPQELADGSLVVVASNGRSGRSNPFWLFRFSAAGAWQQVYPFISQVLTTNTNNGSGYFGVAQGLQPLSDSSLVVVAGGSDTNSSRVYLAHLRVPGLPRVIDSHYIPTAQPLAAQPGRPPAVRLTLYPNPTSATLTVRGPGTTTGAPALFTLTDLLGRPVLTQPLPGAAEVTVSVRGLPPGLYQAAIRVAGQVLASGKLAITR